MRAERTHGTLEGFDVFVDVHIQDMPIIHKNKSIIGLILKAMETRVMEFQVWGYKVVMATSSGILKAKQKLGRTFNSDKLGGIDFTKISKLTMCSA